jgi:hypothetical protein
VLLTGALVLAGCGVATTLSAGGDEYGDTRPTYSHDTKPPHTKPDHNTTTTGGVPNTQIGNFPICHLQDDGSYVVITVPEGRLEEHRQHGDIYPVPAGGCPAGNTTTTNKHDTTSTAVSTSTTSTTINGVTTTIQVTTTTVNGTTTTVTSTTIGGTTTTTRSVTPPITGPATPEVFVRAAGSICDNEVPKIRITFGNLAQFDGQVGTLTMRDVNGNVISVQPLTYQAGTSVDLLYPGTAVNPDGSIDDVPGWILTDDGFWVEDPSDAYLRQGITLTYEVNPSVTTTVTYPPESSGCANPKGPFRPAPVQPPQAPPTPGGIPITM